jgi:hypothetical protein
MQADSQRWAAEEAFKKSKNLKFDLEMEPDKDSIRRQLQSYDDIPADLFMNLSNVESYPVVKGKCWRLPSVKDLFFANGELQVAQLRYGRVHVISCYLDDLPSKQGQLKYLPPLLRSILHVVLHPKYIKWDVCLIAMSIRVIYLEF